VPDRLPALALLTATWIMPHLWLNLPALAGQFGPLAAPQKTY